jgi:hypothetical protein
MIKEIWKDIQWYEWLYQVSNYWKIKNIKTNSILKWWIGSWYKNILLCKHWKIKSFTIHRLVWQSFIENITKKACINHKNWIKTDNRVENLEWVTYSENENHSKNVLKKDYSYTIKSLPNNTWKFWINHPSSKKVNQYNIQWCFLKTRYGMKDIERNLNIKATSICACCRWKVKTAWWFVWTYWDFLFHN